MASDNFLDSQGAQTQKEGQKDQGTIAALGRPPPLALLLLPGPSLLSGSPLASLELHQTS